MDRRGQEEPGEARRSQKSQEEPGGCIKASKTTIGSEKIGVGLPTNTFSLVSFSITLFLPLVFYVFQEFPASIPRLPGMMPSKVMFRIPARCLSVSRSVWFQA